MTTVAFVGVGTMGAPMAANLVAAGFDVVGYNRTPERVERLATSGVRAAGTLAAAVEGADAVAVMVPDSPDVTAVLTADHGVFAHAARDTLVVNFSTIRPDTAVDLAAAARQAGLRMVDAPVSGGEQGAIDATLSIMVGGDLADVEAARGILDAVGTTVVHVGPAGAGQIVKAANQLVVAGIIELVAEALVFLEAHGVDTEAAVRVLSGGLAGNAVLDRKAAGMRERNFVPGFRIQLHHKDLGILAAAARDVNVVLPLGAHVTQLVASLNAQGLGHLDHTALISLVEQLSGRA